MKLGTRLNIEYHELGDMHYEVTLLTELQAWYVETLTIASCARRILDRWHSEGLKKLISVKKRQTQMGYGTRKLVEAGRRLMAMLLDHVPSDNSLNKVVLAMFQIIVKPNMPAYNDAVAAFDGQVMKIDGTFKCATVVLVREKKMVKKKAKMVPRNVAGAVLVAVGIEGLCLRDPKLVPWENGESMFKFAVDILKSRRYVLGKFSAPAACTTDHIRQHANILWKAILKVYPELSAAFHSQKGKGVEETPVLMLQDIEHRLWKFTLKIAGARFTGNSHADYCDYVATMKEVFHQLRVPSDDPNENLEAYLQRNSKWLAERIQTYFPLRAGQRKVDAHDRLDQQLRKGLLEPDKADNNDDDFTLKTLTALGNATIVAFWEKERLYIPRRILIRTARRLRMSEEDIKELFPDHGYPDADNFSFHLRGANEFFKVSRSRARSLSIDTVVEGLSFDSTHAWPQPSRQSGPRRRKKRRPPPVTDFDNTPQETGVKGITDSPLLEDAILGCEEKTTLQGLLGHKLIRGINTDETTVEAVNKYLNSNTRQGPIGYDVAEMRLCYQRLKWDSAVLWRIIFGDISRSRQSKTKAQSVLNLASTVLAGTTTKWYFKHRRIEAPTRTTADDLLEMGYKLKAGGNVPWTDEEVNVFFRALARFRRTKLVIGNYPTVYAWISQSMLKASRTMPQVRRFAELVFNARKKVRRCLFCLLCVLYAL